VIWLSLVLIAAFLINPLFGAALFILAIFLEPTPPIPPA
jgi:hypothetical protein